MPRLRREPKKPRERKPPRKLIHRLVENDLIRRVSYPEYTRRVRQVYDGPQGAMLAAFSLLSLHTPLGDRLLRTRQFDLRGAKSILDVGSGAGQILRRLVKYADADAAITGIDISHRMLRRARRRVRPGPEFVTADLTRLPFADDSFDCVTCGYVLEHLPDARAGLAELARVMAPGAKMLLLTTEDNFPGACTSRVWRCRTYNRQELLRTSEELGLVWMKELWYTRMHRALRAGGICVQIEKARKK
jgi:ubiquinone/menaquinone biosynthesis C-methylase UbiE